MNNIIYSKRLHLSKDEYLLQMCGYLHYVINLKLSSCKKCIVSILYYNSPKQVRVRTIHDMQYKSGSWYCVGDTFL